MVFRSGHIVEQKFQDDRAAQTPPLNFELGKPVRQIDVLNILDPDKAGILHRVGKAVAPRGVRRDADVLRAGLTEIFPAHVFIAGLSVRAGEPAALVAQKLKLPLLSFRQRVKLVKGSVQAEIRHNTAKFPAVKLRLKLCKIRQHLGRGGDEIEAGVALSEILQQQIGAENHAAWNRAVVFKQAAQGVAFRIAEVLFPQERIAEGQARGDPVFPCQRRGILRLCVAEADPAAAPETVRRRAVDRPDPAPVVEVFPMLPIQGQKRAVQFVKLKQAGEMIKCFPCQPHTSTFRSRRAWPCFHAPRQIQHVLRV